MFSARLKLLLNPNLENETLGDMFFRLGILLELGLRVLHHMGLLESPSITSGDSYEKLFVFRVL